MSNNENFGFGKFVPGFDFLQNLAKGASQALPQMPNLSNWIAPTLNVDELDKRIGELKAVHFWLDQNSKALSATIQALEVQKMTLATLQGMNFEMGDVANALKLEPAGTIFPGPEKAGDGAAADASASAAGGPAQRAARGKNAKGAKSARGQPANAALVDPLQWWGALTQQFQQIAATAMQEVAATADGALGSSASQCGVWCSESSVSCDAMRGCTGSLRSYAVTVRSVTDGWIQKRPRTTGTAQKPNPPSKREKVVGSTLGASPPTSFRW